MGTPKNKRTSQGGAELTGQVLGFLSGTGASMDQAPLPPNHPSYLDGLGVRDAAEPVRLKDFHPDEFKNAISNTLLVPLNTTSSNFYVSKLIGASQQPTVPAVLTDNAILRSWGSSLPWIPTTDLTPEYYYGLVKAVPSALGFDSGASFVAYPNSADLGAYLKVVAAIKAGTYSQTARMDQSMGPAVPFLPISGSLASLDYPIDFLAKTDMMMLDPLGASALAPRLAPRLASSDFNTVFAWNGQLDPLAEADPQVTGLLPFGTAYGMDMLGSEDNVEGSPSYNAILEFVRQMVCSPLLKMVAVPRPTLKKQPGLALHSLGFNWNPLTLNESDAFTLPGSIGLTGAGGLSVLVSFILRNDTKNEEQNYPDIDFSVNFTVADGVNPPSLLIPRGVDVSNIFHPGFKLPDGATSPIVLEEGNFYSYSLRVKVLTWGVASNYIWGLEMSNPASATFNVLV